jgi:hypothetical protein
MAQICDSLLPQNLSLVKKNYVGVMRYTKNVTAEEFDATLSEGLTFTLVCEGGSQPALRGTEGGTTDAKFSNQVANEIGYDEAATIYYVAEDPTTLPVALFQTVEEYFRAVNEVGGRPVGAYGGLALVMYLITAGLAAKGWVVETWGGTGTSPLICLEQLVGAEIPGGLSVDTDAILQADYGQHPRPTHVVPTQQSKEDTMQAIYIPFPASGTNFPSGVIKVYAASPTNHLLEFTRTPGNATSNSVIDITDQIGGTEPYTVEP